MNDYGIPARLTTAETIQAGGQQPTIRIRNEHSHTLKDAWRLSSSTVEITFSLASYPTFQDATNDAFNMLADLQRAAFEAGQLEAVRRNEAGHRESIDG